MEFKTQESRELFTSLSPILIMIYADLNWYVKLRHNIDLVITETVSTLAKDKILNRKSSSHREHRAIDIRTNGLDKAIIAELVFYINNKPEYKKYHYLSNSGQTRLAYWHNSGHGDHIHMAIHSNFKVLGIKSE